MKRYFVVLLRESDDLLMLNKHVGDEVGSVFLHILFSFPFLGGRFMHFLKKICVCVHFSKVFFVSVLFV